MVKEETLTASQKTSQGSVSGSFLKPEPLACERGILLEEALEESSKTDSKIEWSPSLEDVPLEAPVSLGIYEVTLLQARQMRFMQRAEVGPRTERYYSPEELAAGQKIQELSVDTSVMVFVGDRDPGKIGEVGQWAGSDEYPLGLVFNGSDSEEQYEHALISTRWPDLDKYKLAKFIAKNLQDREIAEIDGEDVVSEGMITFVEGTETRTITKSQLELLSRSWLDVCLKNSARLHAEGKPSSMLIHYIDEIIGGRRQLEEVRGWLANEPAKERHLAAVA